MRIEWLNKNGSDRVVLFFNGWGMDSNAVSHLGARCDIVMCNDYRSLDFDDFPASIKGYRETYLVAWSMGVWAAANTVPLMNINLSAAIALNGTEHPVDDSYGIPSKIYQLTEHGMNEQGREKFVKRMFGGRDETVRFEQNKSLRNIEDVCEELMSIRWQSTGNKIEEMKWNKVYIAEKDMIFPVKSQVAWWQEKSPVLILSGGHYPFYHFESWEEIIGQE